MSTGVKHINISRCLEPFSLTLASGKNNDRLLENRTMEQQEDEAGYFYSPVLNP